MRKKPNRKVTFEHVAGLDEIVSELELLVKSINKSKRDSSVFENLPKGIMFYGAPGTGKTLLVKAFCNSVNIPVFRIVAGEISNKKISKKANTLKDVFTKASKKGPSIIFIDEIDALVQTSEFDYESKVEFLNQLLVLLDGYDDYPNVLVIASTNKFHRLSRNLLRPGRFEKHIKVPMPDMNSRIDIINYYLKRKDAKENIGSKEIAKLTPHFSGADIKYLINEASIVANTKGESTISKNHIIEALERITMGTPRKKNNLSTEEKRRIAIHELGHAIVNYRLKGKDEIVQITVYGGTNIKGYVHFVPSSEFHVYTKRDLETMLCFLYGGISSEKFFYNEKSTGSQDDIARATEIAKSMVMELGMSSVGIRRFKPGQYDSPFNQISETFVQKIDDEINRLLKKAYTEALGIIGKNSDLLEYLSDKLVIEETFTKETFEYYVREFDKFNPNGRESYENNIQEPVC